MASTSRPKKGNYMHIQNIIKLLKKEIIELRNEINILSKELEKRIYSQRSDIGIDNLRRSIEEKHTQLNAAIKRLTSASEHIPDNPIVATMDRNISKLLAKVYTVSSNTANFTAWASSNHVDPKTIERILNSLAKMIAILVLLRYYKFPDSIIKDLKVISGSIVSSITGVIPQVSPAIFALYGRDLIAFLNSYFPKHISSEERNNIMNGFLRPSDIPTELPEHEDKLLRDAFHKTGRKMDAEHERETAGMLRAIQQTRKRSRSSTSDRSRTRSSTSEGIRSRSRDRRGKRAKRTLKKY